MTVRPLTLLAVLVSLTALTAPARAAEHITLANGFEIDCARRQPVDGDRVRLFLQPSSAQSEGSYIDVASNAVVRIESIPDLPHAVPEKVASIDFAAAPLTSVDLRSILSHAGALHHIDEDLLASVVKAESAGNTLAVSRTGARGLMQLMPGTAIAMGVADSFRPDQNVAGGAAYLDLLLVRYHDDVALALAAYNAGPGAVDKYHGIPPYRETREYVARVIREFNRRKLLSVQNAKIQIAATVVAAKP